MELSIFILILLIFAIIFLFYITFIDDKPVSNTRYIDCSEISCISKLDINGNRTKIIISGCVLNCAVYLDRIFGKLKLLEKQYDLYYLFFENDSKDATYPMLMKFLKNRKGIVLRELNLITKIPAKTERLAYCRNKLIEYIEKNLQDYEYTLIMDMDRITTNLDVPSVVQAINISDKWDCGFINSGRSADIAFDGVEGEYYDSLALKTTTKNDNCWYDGPHKDRCIIRPLTAWFPDLDLKRIIPKNHDLIEVLSAFGGLGIYKTSFIIGSRYSGKYDGMIECEHVAFHYDIKKNFPDVRMYIIPFMSTCCWGDSHDLNMGAVQQFLKDYRSGKIKN